MYRIDDPELRRRRRNLWLLGTLALLLLGMIAGLAWRISRSIDEELQHVVLDSDHLGDELNHELAIHRNNLMSMGYLAAQFLSGQQSLRVDPTALLRRRATDQNYSNAGAGGAGPADQTGMLVGRGAIPVPGSPLAREMAMALALTPLMRSIRANAPNTPWIYYTSARSFMLLYPKSEAMDFSFGSDVLTREFFTGGTSQKNPERAIFWTHPYVDLAGRGEMVTTGLPVYDGERFLGVICIDLLTTRIRDILHRHAIPFTQLHLLDKAGRPLMPGAQTGLPPGLMATPAWQVQRRDSRHFLHFPLRDAPWEVLVSIDTRQLYLHVLSGRAPHIAAVIILFLCLIFLSILLRNYDKLRELAMRDGLTGLYNRRQFETVAALEFDLVQRSQLMLGLAILDIDYFKKYNDHFGHHQGDQAIRAVARALQGVLRRKTDQVFRVGGEEFAVLLAVEDSRELAAITSSLNEAVRALNLEHPLNPAGRITISIGATMVTPGRWRSRDSAYKLADDALYRAKANGRDQAEIN